MRARALLLVAVVAALALLAAGCGGGEESSATLTTTPTVSTRDGGELTREQIIESALEFMRGDPDNKPDASTATANRMTERQAWERLRQGGVEGLHPTPPPETPAWLVEVRGEFVGFIPGAARPGRYFLIVDLYGVSHSGAFVPDATPTP